MKHFFSIIILLSLLGCSRPEILVVDMNQLFEEFKYTKEMKLEFQQKTQLGQITLDSMYNELVSLENEISRTNSTDLKNAYINKERIFNLRRERFEKYKAELTSDADTKIINQLNQYISDFAKINKFKIVLSKNDKDISVLYVVKDYDRTSEVLNFVNRKYEDK